MKPRILIIGSINMDLILRTPRIPQPGESLLAQSYRYNPGGKGANQAVAVSLLGGEATFVGKTGSDAFAVTLRKSLEEKGVSADFLGVSPVNPSGMAAILLEENGENRIMVYPASNMDLTEADIDRALQRDYDALLIQFEIPWDIVSYACGAAKRKGMPFVADAGPACDFPLEKIPGMEILSPNETETLALCGVLPDCEEGCAKAGRILTQRSGAKNIVFKLGAKGAVLYRDGDMKLFPAYTVKATDTTAAGDAFTAALAVRYLSGRGLEEAIRYANAAGALTVMKMGAQQSIPTKEDVENFMGNI